LIPAIAAEDAELSAFQIFFVFDIGFV